MLKPVFWIFPLAAVTATVLYASLELPVAPPSRYAPAPFAAHSSPPSRNPTEILSLALENLDRLQWLQIDLWHRMTGSQPFELEGRLIRGPGGLARLEHTIHTPQGRGEHLVISDGRILGQGFRSAKNPPRLESMPLPENAPVVCQQILEKKGCRGPLPVLRELREIVTDWKAETGRWGTFEAIRLVGRARADHPRTQAGVSDRFFPGQVCRLILEARTLWPLRVEWLLSEDTPVVEMEFRNPVLDRPLTHQECIETFTFPRDWRPAGS